MQRGTQALPRGIASASMQPRGVLNPVGWGGGDWIQIINKSDRELYVVVKHDPNAQVFTSLNVSGNVGGGSVGGALAFNRQYANDPGVCKITQSPGAKPARIPISGSTAYVCLFYKSSSRGAWVQLRDNRPVNSKADYVIDNNMIQSPLPSARCIPFGYES